MSLQDAKMKSLGDKIEEKRKEQGEKSEQEVSQVGETMIEEPPKGKKRGRKPKVKVEQVEQVEQSEEVNIEQKDEK